MKTVMISVILLIVCVLITSSIQTHIPECIQEKIDAISAGSVWSPPASISRYLYRDQTMYLFSSRCCDQHNNLYNESCNRICAPSGGFSGLGDGRCTDFYLKAEYKEKVWTDIRSLGK